MLIAQTCTADSSYWIDSSCYEKNADFAKTIAESMEMASGAASKNQANEANMKYIAGWIFNMKAWSDAEQVQKNYEIRGIMKGIGGITAKSDLKDASIRIYCDNDQRWQLDGDRPDTPVDKQNANQSPQNQWWVDKTNGFRTKGIPGCHRTGDDADAGSTVVSRTDPKADYGLSYDATMLRPRSVISLCDVSLVPMDGSFPIYTVGEAIAFNRGKITGYKVGKFEAVVSFTLLHELTHCLPWDLLDIKPAYGWTNVIYNPKPFKNSDNYAFYGLFSKLLDNNYNLAGDVAGARAGYIEKLQS